MKYVSRRYLREKWENLKICMESVLDVNNKWTDKDNAADSAERVKGEIADLMDAIRKELGYEGNRRRCTLRKNRGMGSASLCTHRRT